jgi:hypothetical protein
LATALNMNPADLEWFLDRSVEEIKAEVKAAKG